MPKLPPKSERPSEGMAVFAKDTDDAGEPLPAADPEPSEPEPTKPAAKKAPAKKALAKAAPAAAPPKAGADLDLGFAPLDETEDFLRVLMYGREGTAKTTGAALMANSIPKGNKGRVLVVNAEGGLKVVALRRRGVDTSRIVAWPDPKSGVEINRKTLEALHEKVHSDLMDDPESWFGVVIDSITDIVQTVRSQATAKRVAKLMRNPDVDKSLIDEDFVDRDDYGVMSNILTEWLRDMRGLPCHLVITALERVDDKTGMVSPAVNPAFANTVMGYVDIAMYMRATLHAAGEDEDEALAEFRALTRPGKVTRAKERFDLLPRVLAEPTFPRILSYVQGELEEDSDPVQAAYVERRAQEAAADAERQAAKQAAREQRKSGRGKSGTAKQDAETSAA